MATHVALADLEARTTPQRVVQLWDDDGDGAITGTDLTRFDETLAEVDDIIRSVIYDKGFTLAQITLLAPDKMLRRIAADIALQLGGERRTEFQNADGEGPFDLAGERARESLKRISKGELRSKLEATVGTNPVILGDVSVGTPKYVFNRDPSDPCSGAGPGGF